MALAVNAYVSTKLKALSLGAVILVVFIHSHNQEMKFASGPLTGEQSFLVLFVENFLSKGVARIAVPLFFAISGLLFYKSFEFTVSGVLTKLKGRFKNLFIPYLFWSVFGLILILFLQSIPWSRNFFTKELIIDYSISELLLTILVNPIPYQLWFVRDLIMLTVFSPVIWYLTKSTKVFWLLLLAFLWIMEPKTFDFFSNDALFFFTMGCAISIDEELLNYRFPKVTSYCLCILWLLMVSLATYLLTFNKAISILQGLSNLGSLLGVISVWSVYDHLNQDRIIRHSDWFAYSFFIFVFHEPLLTILKKGMFFLWGKTNLTSLVIYVSAPVAAIGFSMLIRYVWRKTSLRSYNFATGRR